MSRDNRDNIFGGGEKFFDVFRIDAADIDDVDVVVFFLPRVASVVRHSLPTPKLDPRGR